MAEKTPVGEAVVKIGVDTAAFKTGLAAMGKFTRGIIGFGNRIRRTFLSLRTVFISTFAVLGINWARGFINDTLDVIDAQSKLARSVGATTEAVQVMQHAAALSNIPQAKMTRAIEQMTRAAGQAAEGSGLARSAFKRLHISLTDFAKLDIDERFLLIAERMHDLKFTAHDTANTMKEFEQRGTEMAVVYENAGANIHRAREELKKFGVIVSDFDARRIEEANDSIYALQLALRGIGNQFAVAIAPWLDLISDKLAVMIADSDGTKEKFEQMFISIAGGSMKAYNAFVPLYNTFLRTLDLFEDDSASQKAAKEAESMARIIERMEKRLAALDERAKKVSGNMSDLNFDGAENFDEAAWVHQVKILQMIQKEYQTIEGQLTSLKKEQAELAVIGEAYASRFLKPIENIPEQLQGILDEIGARDEALSDQIEREARERGKRLEKAWTTNEWKRIEVFQNARRVYNAEIEGSQAQEISRLEQHFNHRHSLLHEAMMLEYITVDEYGREHLRLLDHLEQQKEDVRRKYLERELALFDQHKSWSNENLLENYAQEVAQEEEHFQDKLNRLHEFFREGLFSEEEYGQKRKRLRELHQKEMERIEREGGTKVEQFERKSNAGRLASTIGMFDDMFSGIQTKNRQIFEIQKAAAVANATIDTYKAFNRTLAEYPAPWNYAIAAGVAVAGFARVQSILSTTLNGGGGSAGGRGGGGGAGAGRGQPLTDVVDPNISNRLDVRINTLGNGDFISRDDFRGFISQINEQLEDGAQLGSIVVS